MVGHCKSWREEGAGCNATDKVKQINMQLQARIKKSFTPGGGGGGGGRLETSPHSASDITLSLLSMGCANPV